MILARSSSTHFSLWLKLLGISFHFNFSVPIKKGGRHKRTLYSYIPVAIHLDDLNPAQREAASTIEGPVLVLAGAGTGKTRVITFRMAYMIQKGICPSQILAVTFTNKAANEMKERYLKLVDAKHHPNAFELIASTFHSFCVRVLRKEINLLGYKKNFTIYDASDQLALIKKIITRVAGTDHNLDASTVGTKISLAKNRGIDLSEAAGDQLLQQIAFRYQQDLRLHNAVDFDDLLLLTVQLLREHPEARERLREQHRYLMIDEFQDTNLLQFQLAELLCSDNSDLFVVGDDDQSIYSWRGAESSHILEFHHHFPGAKIVKLEQNYRCTPNILRAANAVIANNVRRHQKQLWAEGNPGSLIRLAAMENDLHEAEWIASDIAKIKRENDYYWEDFAILYRTNLLSRVFEQEFRKMSIPYRILGGMSFYERREVKDILAYLLAIKNPDDDIALLRIINNPPRGIGNRTIEKLLDQSRRRECSIWEEIQVTYKAFSPKAAAALENFVDLLQHYRDAFYMESCKSEILKELLDEIKYFEDLRRSCKDDQEMISRSDNIKELVSALASYEETQKGDLDAFLDTVVLDQKTDDKEDKDQTGVTLMTLHAAKGLEFSHVYLVGLEEGFMPHEKSKLDNNIDEERRLMYVGITRAQKQLTLSHCSNRKKYGQDEPRHPSSFLTELPEDTLDPLDTKIHFIPVEHSQGATQLSALRAKLNSV
ncbi:MAG: UvrD-helicase domain-containing protein [Verrucomicrobiota bacterium]